MVQVSVVLPTCRRPSLLVRCLDALLQQDIAPQDYEIIVVDDAYCEETKCLVERLARNARKCGHTLRYLPGTCSCRPHGPAAARNLGWQAARSNMIAFTDDDCIPSPHWL